ncbi:hypothetical protein NA78x_005737 [Anatilimnocola sp. NA78]|uniref:hypothetical protein n=1 Tax=Anatilimnocola sp. NA78 TaxID=3415683 RepID=UPI003CE48A96
MKKHTAPTLAAILLLLPVLYVGSYLVLVDPKPDMPDSPLSAVPTPNPKSMPLTNYRWGRAAIFFWPLEQLDRKLRPEVWGPQWSDFVPVNNSSP